MLRYLDLLCVALVDRDARAIRRLLDHPLARALPRRAREEALAMLRAGPASFLAPVHTLHFYHQTAHLLGAGRDPAARPARSLPRRRRPPSRAARAPVRSGRVAFRDDELR
jgi:hypothetical protein